VKEGSPSVEAQAFREFFKMQRARATNKQDEKQMKEKRKRADAPQEPPTEKKCAVALENKGKDENG
jgi:hypothetical protein